MSIIFFQSTSIGGNNSIGLFDLLLTHVNSVADNNIFNSVLIVASDYAMVDYISDNIALRNGICANINFEILFGPLLNNIYLNNNPDAKLFDFSHAKYIIYNYLCKTKLTTPDSVEINNYIYPNNKLDKFKTFQLSSQLQQVFHEYMYLRTNELINLERSQFPLWQQQILTHLFNEAAPQITFVEVYNYFMQVKLDNLILPTNIFVFGISSVYLSQLEIIKKLATKSNVYWYYKTCSFEYYGDLLSNKAKSKLERRLLRKPDLSLDDLFLNDANPLLANLGQQSREFIELLRANDIDVYSFDSSQYENIKINNTFLSVLQDDIRNIKYRVSEVYRLNKNNDFYVDPINLNTYSDIKHNIYDLPDQQLSININICHNKMREVQVMFNEIVNILDKNSNVQLSNILISAPHIEDYASYISAVFDNEFVIKSNGEPFKLLYTVAKQQQNNKPLECLKLIINTPYLLPVNYLLDILAQDQIQKSMGISLSDFELIKKWLKDNNTNFGYNEHDYETYGYENYSVHSFKQLLSNLVLGVCLTEQMYDSGNELALYSSSSNEYVPYDNLDFSQVSLCNKLIQVINQLELLRDAFYIDIDTYADLSFNDVHSILVEVFSNLLDIDDGNIVCETFLGSLMNIPQDNMITLPIINLILDEYLLLDSSKINFNGRICCASMQDVRNIPYDYVYLLGMNFGDFPTIYNKNQLSILAEDWALADRNYNIEDKQVFLDIILSVHKQLYLSYIGRKEIDNSEINPSSVLSLFLSCVGQSFTNFTQNNHNFLQEFDFKNMVKIQALHPFYNNKQINFSTIWHELSLLPSKINGNLRWDFNNLIKIDLTKEQQKLYYNPRLKDIRDVFLYTNVNLYKTLNINMFNNDIELLDNEDLNFTSRRLSKVIFGYFEQYWATSNLDQLKQFLITKGVLSYANMGNEQFNYYRKLYQIYINNRGEYANIKFSYAKNINISIEDKIWINDNKIIILDDFHNIKETTLKNKLENIPYSLKISSLILSFLVKNGALINGECSQHMQIIIRQINSIGEVLDSVIDPESLYDIDDLLSIYLYSLTNPILVHKSAINAYSIKKEGSDHIDVIEKAYYNDYMNYDLDKIKDDLIYSSIAEHYLEFVDEHTIQNDIIALGDVLSKLKIIPSRSNS